MKFGSVCSGIEAASVAWHPLGWKAAWLSEIEPFPSAVLAHHYPNVPNLGDMTTLPERIRLGEVEAPDLFCGGTPCQAFSVAGLRNSLNDARGNLSLIFCEIANAIDKRRLDAGLVPSIVFWEQVPGVFSTKDNAFGCFLGALAGEDEPIIPSGGKWTNAGCVYGPQRAVAWRVLDAQYFGVAQRRRRVFVVASARGDFDPAAVLFEFDGVRRDTAPSREARQTAPTIPARSTAGGGLGTDFDCDGGTICVATGQAGAEIGADMAPTLNCNHEAPYVAHSLRVAPCEFCGYTFDHDKLGRYGCPNCEGDGLGVSHSLRGEGFDASEDGTGRGTPLVPVAFHPTQDPISSTDGTTHAMGCGSSGGQESVAVAIQDVRGTDKAQNGRGWNDDGTAYTLDTHATQGVAICGAFFAGQGAKAGSIAYSTDVAPTLKASDSGTNRTPSVHINAVGTDCYNGSITGDVACTMGTPGSSVNASGPTVMQAMQVRRLTPVECERLQGFPDHYTAIPWRGKPVDNCPDGPRYKALGNSWAVPVVRWIGRRIHGALN